MARFLDGSIVATLSAYVTELCLPGEVLASATALIDIGVIPGSRGQGYFKEIVLRFLAEAHERREPLAMLNTDDVHLYPRFGFGVATYSRSATVRGEPAGSPPRIDLDVVEISDLEAKTVLPALFSSVLRERVGEVSRTSTWWQEYFLDAACTPTPTRFTVSVHHEEIDGYEALLCPARHAIGAGVTVAELNGRHGPSSAALVEHALRLGAGRPVRFPSLPTDLDLAPRECASFAVKHGALKPQLWLRIVEVDDALALRGYRGPAELVLEVFDEVAPWNAGAHLLLVDESGRARVSRTWRPAMLSLGVAELASVYLGATSFRELAAQGRVLERVEGALRIADSAFSSPVAPFCSTLL